MQPISVRRAAGAEPRPASGYPCQANARPAPAAASAPPPPDPALDTPARPDAVTGDTPATPGLEAFQQAALAGRLLWVVARGEGRVVCSGQTPAPDATGDVGALFVAALREHFGLSASAVAEREWQLHGDARRVLPARTARRAIASARSAHSLLLAQSSLLQFEFSAVLMGWRFRRLVQGLGQDPAALSLARRQALDLAMSETFSGPPPVDAGAVGNQLRRLLEHGLQ